MHFCGFKVLAMIFNQNTLNLEDKIILEVNENAYIDYNLLHKETIFINQRIFLI